MIKLEDKQLKEFDLLETLVKEENKSQLNKWGVQTHSPFQWLTYLTEELGELAEAIAEDYHREQNPRQVYSEAIQVATLALKIAEMYIWIENEILKGEEE